MEFHQWFPQRLMEEYGLKSKIYGLQYHEQEDGDSEEVRVDDPYISPKTTMEIEIRGKVLELHERDKFKQTLWKPHIKYSYEDRYQFMMHQIKYKIIKDSLSYTSPISIHTKKFYRVKTSSTERFEGVDIFSQEQINIEQKNPKTSISLPKKIMNTHAEQFARGYDSERGLICIPIGHYRGYVLYTSISIGEKGTKVEIARFYNSDNKIYKENITNILTNDSRHVAMEPETNIEVPWENYIKHPMDLYKNPLNKNIWYLLSKSRIYEGNLVFINYETDVTYIKIVDQWVPTDKTWLLSHTSTFMEDIQNELSLINEITDSDNI